MIFFPLSEPHYKPERPLEQVFDYLLDRYWVNLPMLKTKFVIGVDLISMTIKYLSTHIRVWVRSDIMVGLVSAPTEVRGVTPQWAPFPNLPVM